jgi:hypothetical protein
VNRPCDDVVIGGDPIGVGVDRAQTDDDVQSVVKPMFRGSGKLLGAHIMAALAGAGQVALV